MITKIWLSRCWQLGVAGSLAMVGVVGVVGDRACAQIKPDNTLGAESSVVTPNVVIRNVPSDQIDGGAIRGANLFHSFQEFNVGEGRGAYFTNPTGIENILSRVTGGSRSNIFGRLGVLGNANLFLINPNGTIFGPNSSLDVKGSFVTTSADAIGFGNQGFFSASDPTAPPLLTVNPSAFLFNQIAAQPITNQSAAGLQVPNGRSLLLVGGDVKLAGGQLQAPGGFVELGGVAESGTVGLSVGGNNLRLSYPAGVQRADVSLNGAGVNVAAGSGGSIAVNAGNLDVLGGSVLLAGIRAGSGSISSQAGDIELDITGAMTVAGSYVFNAVSSGATGNAGDINIKTGSLSLSDGAALSASTSGQGDAGSVVIEASDTISFDGRVSSNGSSSSAFSTVEAGAVGSGGDINIKTGSLLLTNGAQLAAGTRGKGDAGSVIIEASDTISFDGVSSNGFASGPFSIVGTGAVGSGGDINIKTGSLSVTDGARLNASTFGRGDAGSVNITASDNVSFDGESYAFSAVESGALGNGGSINIQAGSLSLTDGAQLLTIVREATEDGKLAAGQGNAGNVKIDVEDAVTIAGFSQANGNRFPSGVRSSVGLGVRGNGGDINIKTGSLSVTDGARLTASTFGQGDAGSVMITASDNVSFDGESYAFSTVESGAVGNGGGINIKTGSLSLTNGAGLTASTFGQGDAGSVMITASDTVSFDGVGSNRFASGAFSNVGNIVETRAVGKGGNVNVTTGSLSLTNGAELNASTFGQGDAGSVTITASDTVSFDGVGSNGFASGAYSGVGVEAVGNGGDINVTARSLSFTNGGQLSAGSEGSGAAGNIEVTARSIRLDNLARLRSETIGGQGNIFLRSQDLVLRRGSNITTNATGKSAGGNITIDTGFIAALENSDITANAEVASGGRVIINAQGIFGTEFRNQQTPESDITASSNLGPQFSGTVEINTPDVDLSQGLVTLPVELIDTSELIANSCIARSSQQGGSFIITGTGGLPTRPGGAYPSPFPTGTVRSIPSSSPSSETSSSSVSGTNPVRPWKLGDPIVEAQGLYRLADGQLVLSRECPN